jgi:sarcosine oxidase delta subunit
MSDLVCPYCGKSLSLNYVYEGSAYSEFRSVDTIECDNYSCSAAWDREFHQVSASKLKDVTP